MADEPTVTPETIVAPEAPVTPEVPVTPEPVADWRANLDPAIKDHACLQSFKTYGDLAKSYVNVQPLIGVDKLPMPPKDAKPEVREKFMNDVFDRLGRPKEAKDYKLTEVKLPDGINFKIAPDAMEGLKAQAHNLGLLPSQLDGLYAWYMNDTASRVKLQQEQARKSIDEVTAELRSEWGAAFDAKKNLAEKVLDKFATSEEKAHLINTGFNNDPKVIRMLARFGDIVSDDTFEKGGGEVTMTPEEANRELGKIRQQLVDMPKSNPEYKELLKRRFDLMRMAGA